MRRNARFAEDEFAAREYARLQTRVLGALRSRARRNEIHFDDLDLQGFYNSAFHTLLGRLRKGETVERLDGFLVTVAWRRAIEDSRAQHPDRHADGADISGRCCEIDIAAELEHKRQLREWLETAKSQLDEREAKATVLCMLHGYKRSEVAALMGESERRMEKILDRAQRKLAGFYADITQGTRCETPQMRSMMRAYAIDLLPDGSPRHAQARAHLNACPQCRCFVRGLRGLAAVMPPVALPIGGGEVDAFDEINAMLDAVWRQAGDLLHAAGERTVELTGGVVVAAGAGAGSGAAGLGASAGAGTGSGVLGGVAATVGAKVAVVCAAAAVCAGGTVAVVPSLEALPERRSNAPHSERVRQADAPVAAIRQATPARTAPIAGRTIATKSSATSSSAKTKRPAASSTADVSGAATQQHALELGFERGSSLPVPPPPAPQEPAAARAASAPPQRPVAAPRGRPSARTPSSRSGAGAELSFEAG